MIPINLMTSLSNTGYGVVGKNLTLELFKTGGIDITLWPYGSIPEGPDKRLLEALVYQQNMVDPKATCINIWHQFDLAKRIGNGPYYAWPFFELDRFNARELAHLSVPHYLIASSEWAKNILCNQVPNSIVYKVPCGVDTNTFKPNKDGRHKDNQPYTFFNIGKWEKRKGHDVLIRAFDKAFETTDDVHLVMMPHNPFLREHQLNYWTKMYTNAKLHSKVTLLNPVATHTDVAKIINQCDCGVFPSHAEGWNLELLESMACGKPVIATNNSAHTEFCDGVNSFLIETPNMETAFDGIFFTGQGEWAEIDMDEEDQLIEYMRYCYQERPNNLSGIATADRFTWTRSAGVLIEILIARKRLDFCDNCGKIGKTTNN